MSALPPKGDIRQRIEHALCLADFDMPSGMDVWPTTHGDDTGVLVSIPLGVARNVPT